MHYFASAQTPDSNLWNLSKGWVQDVSPVLTSAAALILPAVGHTDLIESRKRIEIPQIDANLALAA